MKQEIEKTEFYSIHVDQSINRLYISVKGFWSDKNLVERYALAQTRAISYLKPKYSLVADVRALKTLPSDLVPIHKVTQDELIETGVHRVAEIMPQSVIANMQMKDTTTNNNMPRRQFADPREGEKWLDSVTANT